VGTVAPTVGGVSQVSWSSRYRAAIRALAGTCADLGVRWMIIGGIGVVARGVVRTTDDVDATVWAPGLDVEAAFAACQRHGVLPRVADSREMAERAQILLLRHDDSGIDLDVSLAWMPFEDDALSRASDVDLGEGVHAPVAQAEDLVIYKTVAWRSQDQQDIERLLQRHGRAIDLTRVRRYVAEFAQLLEVPEREQEFEALVARIAARPH